MVVVHHHRVSVDYSVGFPPYLPLKKLFKEFFNRSKAGINATQVGLAEGSDTGFIGDRKTAAASITLSGKSAAFAKVTIKGLGVSTIADNNGQYSFSNIGLKAGRNKLTIVASDIFGNKQTVKTTLFKETADQSGIIVDWNDTLLKAIALDRTAPHARREPWPSWVSASMMLSTRSPIWVSNI